MSTRCLSQKSHRFYPNQRLFPNQSLMKYLCVLIVNPVELNYFL